MSKYSTEVRFICETAAGLKKSEGYEDVESIIEAARGSIFKAYPIFNEEYRKTLETKILEHYYTCEIGFETVGLWKLNLNRKMNEIMPYYNKLYESELLEWDWDKDTQYTIEYAGETSDLRSGTTKGTRSTEKNENTEINDINNRTIDKDGTDTTTYNSTLTVDGTIETEHNATNVDNGSIGVKDLYSDTPMNGLEQVESGEYLTNARVTDTETSNRRTEDGTDTTTEHRTDKKTGNDTVTRTEDTTDKYDGNRTIENTGGSTENTSGESAESATGTKKSGTIIIGKQSNISFSEYLMKYRDTFLNIDMMVIEELRDCFMLLW